MCLIAEAFHQEGHTSSLFPSGFITDLSPGETGAVGTGCVLQHRTLCAPRPPTGQLECTGLRSCVSNKSYREGGEGHEDVCVWPPREVRHG